MPAKLYDWEEWFSHESYVLRRGVHYDCPQSTMAQQVRNAASVRGILVHLTDEGESIAIVKRSPHKMKGVQQCLLS